MWPLKPPKIWLISWEESVATDTSKLQDEEIIAATTEFQLIERVVAVTIHLMDWRRLVSQWH